MNRRLLLASAAAAMFAAAQSLPATSAEPGFETDGHVALNAYQGVVEEHLAGVLNALKAVAPSAEARSGKWEDVKPQVMKIAEGITTDAAVWYVLPDGSYHTADGGLSDQNLKDREYFPGLMSGKDVVGALVVSKATGHRSVIVATPVVQDGKVVAALGVSVRARLLSDLVKSRTNMPDELIFYALDASGQTAIHRDPDKMFQFPSDMGDPGLKDAVAKILGADAGGIVYEFQGKPRTAVFSKSALTGWHFVLVRENK